MGGLLNVGRGLSKWIQNAQAHNEVRASPEIACARRPRWLIEKAPSFILLAVSSRNTFIQAVLGSAPRVERPETEAKISEGDILE